MSKVFNMVGGGGGKNISSIIITGLESTDTVTCTKDGKSYTATWDENDKHWEIVGLPLGTFIVTATNGTKTTTETVLIDIAGVYEITMEIPTNYLMLYDYGDECEDITGGWVLENSYSSKAATYLNVNSSRTLYAVPTIFSNIAIDFSGYKELHTIFDNKWSAEACTGNIEIASIRGGSVDGGVLVNIGFGAGAGVVADNLHLYGDVSSLSEPAYVRHIGYYSNPQFRATWLVKEDDYAEVANIAGITASSIDDMIANSATILANEQAVRAMLIKCTGDFMSAATTSSAFRTALASSPYKELVYANVHWSKFLAMIP